jgi:choline monooxygenase
MSDLSLQLQQASGQLPVSTYFDEALYQRELQTLFQRGPRYVGHTQSVPQVGDYCALAPEHDGRVLVHTGRGVELVSNVCRHRQALMLQGRGSLAASGGNIVCPVHRWTYDGGASQAAGTQIGAPHFANDPCLNLHNYPLQEWNGLLFEANGCQVSQDLAAIGERAMLDFSGFVLDRVELHTCNYNWKTFIEVYLEDYHVAPFHPGLGHFVSCDDLRWEFGPRHSVQTVGVSGQFGQPGSPVYQRWHEALLRYRQGQMPERGGSLADLLSAYHGRVVPPCVDRVNAASDGCRQNTEQGRVLLSRRNSGLRARVCRGAASRLHGNLCRR